ncbi:hypothetical protein X801_07893, partial [Opisthorchis viverrini]
GFAKIAIPVIFLLQKNTPFVWSEEQAEAFKQLRDCLCSTPILAYPDISPSAGNFILDTDASENGIGAMQPQHSGDAMERASIGQTPSFMTTGQGMRLPSDTTLPISAPEALYSSVFVRRMQAGLVRSHELARQRLRAAQRCQKGYYDKAAQDMLFNLGDWVWLYEPVPPTGTPAKFHGAWKGPYTIDQAVTDVTYRLIHPGKSNWSTAASIGQTPSFMTTGQGMRLPSDTTLPISAPEALYSSVFVRRMQAGLVRSHELARQRLRAAQRCQKGYYDKAAQDMLFNLGDWVWLYEPVPPTGTPAKFHGAWKGPYTIDQAVTDVTYRLIHPGKSNWST